MGPIETSDAFHPRIPSAIVAMWLLILVHIVNFVTSNGPSSRCMVGPWEVLRPRANPKSEASVTPSRGPCLLIYCWGILPDFSGGTWDSMVPSSVPMSLRRFHNFSRCLFREPPFLWTERTCKGVFQLHAQGAPHCWQPHQAALGMCVGRLYGKRHHHIPHETSEDAEQTCGCKKMSGARW